ncbi:MAG: sulfatase, partial [Akkermansiaceae bacterium]|nr:sulfatase [Akkermansiaceae bacterium]
MSRLTFLVLALLTLGAVAAEKPNFVFIFSDDVNRDSWGVYGNPDCKTPNIDQLAEEGMLFERAYCTVAMCAPFRQELYSGRTPWRTTTLANHSTSTKDTKSIPHYLQPLGYRVGLIGKSHIGPKEAYPFDFMKGGKNKGIVKTAAAYIDKSVSENKNFCLFLASKDGHAPVTAGDASAYPPDKLTVPSYWLDTPELRGHLGRYYAEVTNFDELVGMTRAMLADKGLLENTVLMVCSEQGVQFPFAKWTCFDNGLHMGLIAYYPKRIKPGSRAPQLISLMDVTPTLVELAGGELEAGEVDGRSFVPVLDGKPEEINDYVYGAFTNCKILDNKKRI